MCFAVLLGLIVPRLTLLGIWLIRPVWLEMLSPWWVGFLGWLFVPFTTLGYVLVHAWSGTVDLSSAPHLILLAIALAMDIGVIGGGSRKRTKKD